MFTSDTCTNLVTNLVSYVALITTIVKCKYVPLIRVHTRISILLFVHPCSIPNWPTLYNNTSYNGQTGNHTYLSCRNLIFEEHEYWTAEEQRRRHRHPWASMPDGPAAPSVFYATDRTSGQLAICSYMTGWGSQGQGVRGDNRGQINIFGFRVFQFQ